MTTNRLPVRTTTVDVPTSGGGADAYLERHWALFDLLDRTFRR
ncbi:hypothetical protein [Micromonospora sp. U56]|nr:hypothetical protein [Micromonospora sp. U56]